ncbi:MAG TPA: 5-deoxy-glucuronate isomerase [Bryobacterales bacterium]|nr:5-deoxy-glucuronate isomerase [Bryobacterales bacterium]
MQPHLQIKSPLREPGVYPIVQRGRELKHLSFTVVQLGGSRKEYAMESGEEELAVDFYPGKVRVEVDSAGGRFVRDTQLRRSLKEAGEMLYVPAGAKLKLTLLSDAARVGIAGALGKPGGKPVFISREQVVSKQVGKPSWLRTVHTHIADNVDAARLIVGETVNEPGNWSSSPPHKHDRHAPPSEVPMEEVYFFQVEPRGGFGYMRVYTDPADPQPFDCAYTVEDGDTVVIPRGYHPVAAFPGYTLNYTWALAGEGRTYGAWSDDPKHAWIKQN